MKYQKDAYGKKLAWVKTLKVGDTVEDCRFKNLKIKEIRDINFTKYPNWLSIISRFLPVYFLIGIDNLLRKIGYVELADRQLTLEDGQGCSAMNCCSEPMNFD